MFFGRRNAWADGPPPPGGGGGGYDPGPGGGVGVRGQGGGAAVRDQLRRVNVHAAAKALMFQRRKKEENRALVQETLKRDVIKETNYMIFQLREGEDQCSYDTIGKVLDDIGLTSDDVVSITGNPFNPKEIEVLLKDDVNAEVANWSKKLDDMHAPVTVDKIGKMEEVFIIRNLPLTLDHNKMKKWIHESVSPFVTEVHDIIPLKYSRRRLGDLSEEALKFFDGKFDGSWRVSVNPKGAAEVPSFVAFGPDNLQGTVKYSKRGQPVNELCWACYMPGHKRNDKDETGGVVCPGPKDWKDYVKEFQDNAIAISGKSAEDLFPFTEQGPLVARLERELADIAENLEKSNKEKEDRENAMKVAEETMEARMEQTNKDWRARFSKLEEEMLTQRGELEKRLETSNEKTEKEKSLEAEMELLRVKLNEAELRNSQLKEDSENMRKENMLLFNKSIDDTAELVNISKQNEHLVNMVAKESTLGDEDDASDESVNTEVAEKYDMDPLIEDDTVFDGEIAVDTGIVNDDHIAIDTEMVIDDQIAVDKENGGSGKHALSPTSAENGLPSEKMIAMSSGTPVIQKTPVTDSPASLPPPSHSPPPPPIKTKPPLPIPIPPFKRFKAGNLVEIFNAGGGGSSVIAKLLSCQTKKGSQDYEKYKDFWNVEIVKGNSVYVKGVKMGFDFTNPHHYKFVPPSTSKPKSGEVKGAKTP